jgi:hypothetical protein
LINAMPALLSTISKAETESRALAWKFGHHTDYAGFRHYAPRYDFRERKNRS